MEKRDYLNTQLERNRYKENVSREKGINSIERKMRKITIENDRKILAREGKMHERRREILFR